MRPSTTPTVRDRYLDPISSMQVAMLQRVCAAAGLKDTG